MKEEILEALSFATVLIEIKVGEKEAVLISLEGAGREGMQAFVDRWHAEFPGTLLFVVDHPLEVFTVPSSPVHAYVEGDAGDVEAFVQAWEDRVGTPLVVSNYRVELTRIPEGPVLASVDGDIQDMEVFREQWSEILGTPLVIAPGPTELFSRRPYTHVQTGGTFDRLHEGHKDLLRKAFEVGDTVTIGMTADALVRDKYLSELIQPFEVRMTALQNWLDAEYGFERYRIVVNTGVYNDHILDPSLEATILVDKTFHHGQNINALREKHGLPPVDFVMTETSNVSSSELRRQAYREKYGTEPPEKSTTQPVVDSFQV